MRRRFARCVCKSVPNADTRREPPVGLLVSLLLRRGVHPLSAREARQELAVFSTSSVPKEPRADSFGQIRLTRSGLLAPVVVLILTISAIAGVWLLVGQVSSSREAQLRVSSQTLALADLQSAPFNADPAAGGSGTASLLRIRADEGSISRALTAHAQVGVPTSLLSAGRVDLGAIAPVVLRIYGLAVRPGGLSGAGTLIPKLQGTLTVRAADLGGVLSKIGQADAA